MEAVIEFKHPTKRNGRIFTRYPVNASENGEFNTGRKSILIQCLKFWLERRKKKKKVMDLHERRRSGFAVFVPSLSLAWNILKSEEEKKMLKKVWSYPVDFCIRFRTLPDNPT